MDTPRTTRDDIRDFLVSRRGRLTPEQLGLPSGTRRRVPGLRREEVAVLAGVSTEWYSRLEKGHITGVSPEVLTAVARALQLTDDERSYLFDLAAVARSSAKPAVRRRDPRIEPATQWLIDSITLSAVFLRNHRLDVLASNELARALHAPMFDSPTTTDGHANFARYHFLDATSHDFFLDWEGGAAATVALLRAAAGREPEDRALRELIGELSTQSADFRTLWASHDIRTVHEGIKRLQHPIVGPIELSYRSAELSSRSSPARSLNLYTAEPGTSHEENLKLLASWNTAADPQKNRRASTA